MAKNNNLTDCLTAIADAIREKKGTDAKIPVQSLDQEVLSISGSDGLIKEVIKEIDGTEPSDGVALANTIARVCTDIPTEQVFVDRTTANGKSVKSTLAYVDKIKGKTVKTKQLVDIKKVTKGGGIGSFVRDGNTITITSTVSSNNNDIRTTLSLSENHKFLVACIVSTDNPDWKSLVFYNLNTALSVDMGYISSIPSLTAAVFTPVGNIEGNIVRFRFERTTQDGKTAIIKNPVIFNLTEMFGEGKEPATVDEFCQIMFGCNKAETTEEMWTTLADYDEGSLKSFTADKVISKDAEGNILDELSVPISSITDADGNQLFPYGLLSAGDIYDEITETQAIKRIGVVDLADVVSSASTTSNLIYGSIGDIKPNTPNIICAELTAKAPEFNSYSGQQLIVWVYKETKWIRMRLENYVYSLAEARGYVRGYLLYYELETPVVVPLPPRKSFYKLSADGRESIHSEGYSTPLTADIAYRSDISAEDIIVASSDTNLNI